MSENTKKLLMPAIVLTLICLTVSALLAGINLLTKDIIAEAQLKKENEALIEVYPSSSDFTKLTELPTLPAPLTEVYSAGDGGYVFKAEVSGYASGLVILIGVDPEGKITGAKHVKSGETYGLEPELNNAYNGQTLDSLTLIIASGATPNSATSKGYYNAMDSALTAFAIMGGANVDLRTPEQIRNEEANAILGTEGLKFVPWVAHTGVENAESLFICDNGAALYVIEGEDGNVYIAFDENGNCANSEAIPEDQTQTVDAVHKSFYDTVLTKSELTSAGVTSSNVLQVAKLESGSYVMVVQAKGYANFEYSGVTEPIKVRVVIGTDGVIISTLTLEQHESAGYGAVCDDPEYYNQYNGKTKDTYTEVDDIAGATYTSDGYKDAIKIAFLNYERLMNGGTKND